MGTEMTDYEAIIEILKAETDITDVVASISIGHADFKILGNAGYFSYI